MKKINRHLISVILINFLLIVGVNAQELSEKLRGKILLQVEGDGQAWYVEPGTKERAFLGRPADAFRIMRELGLGISENDFNSFNEYAPSRLSGKILLRVEANGEAYYVFPDDLKLYYLGRPNDAFEIMRGKGLGITNLNLGQIQINQKYSETAVYSNAPGQEEQSEELSAIELLQKQLDEQAKQIESLQAQQEQKEIEESLDSLTANEIVEKIKPSIVYITAGSYAGTGMIFESNGYILTNAHVVSGHNYVDVKLLNGSTYTATVIGRDELIDLAVIKIGATNLSYVEFGNSGILKQGEKLYTIGYSLGISDDVSIKEGIYSRKINLDDIYYLESSAEMQPGNSGGALVNEYGFVVGVTTRIQDIEGIQDLITDPMKLSIPINTANSFVPLLKEGRNVTNGPTSSVVPEPDPTPTPNPAPTLTPNTVSFTYDLDTSTSPAKDVGPGTDNVIIGVLELSCSGGNITINNIGDIANDNFSISGTGLEVNEISNIEMYNTETGQIYDLNFNFNNDKYNLELADEIELSNGETNKYYIRVDLAGASDINTIDNGDSLKVNISKNAFDITGADNISPNSDTGANNSIVCPSLTWSTTALTAKTLLPGASDVVIYKASLRAGASSDVTITSVKLDVDDSYYLAFKDDNITQLKLYIGGRLVKSVSNKIVNDGLATGYISFSSLDTSSRVVRSGQTEALEVKADFSSSFTGSNFALELVDASSVIARDIDSNTFTINVYNPGADSRKITFAYSATMKAELKTDDSKADENISITAGDETEIGSYMAELVFTSNNEPIIIKSLVLSQCGTADSNEILSVKLYDNDGYLIATEAPSSNGDVDFDSLDYEIVSDAETSIFIGVATKDAGYGNTIQFSFGNSSDLSGFGYSTNQAIIAQGVNSGESVEIIESSDSTVNIGEYSPSNVCSMSATIIE